MWQDNKHGHMRFLCPEYQPKPYGIVYAHRSASTMCVDKLVLRISRGVFRKYQKHVPMSKHLKQYTMNMYTYTHGNKSFSPCPLGRIIYVRHRSGKRNNWFWFPKHTQIGIYTCDIRLMIHVCHWCHVTVILPFMGLIYILGYNPEHIKTNDITIILCRHCVHGSLSSSSGIHGQWRGWFEQI